MRRETTALLALVGKMEPVGMLVRLVTSAYSRTVYFLVA